MVFKPKELRERKVFSLTDETKVETPIVNRSFKVEEIVSFVEEESTPVNEIVEL